MPIKTHPIRNLVATDAKGLFVVILSCLVLGLGACSDDKSSNNNGNGGSLGVDATAVVTALCNWTERCASSQGKVFASAAECADVMVNGMGDGCEPLRFDNTAGEVQACAASLDAADCTTNLFQDGAPTAACAVLKAVEQNPYPTTTPGGNCEHADCPSGYYCDYPTQYPTTLCSFCAPFGALNQGCDDSYECAASLYCDEATMTCKTLKAVNDSCGDDSECTTDYCASPADTCQRTLARNAACSSGQRCAGYLVCLGGVCTDRGGEGAACTLSDFGDCLIDYQCVSGFCRKVAQCGQGQVGGACNSHSDCVTTAYCDYQTYTCVAKVALGVSCSSSVACLSPNVCNNYTHVCAPLSDIDGPCSYATNDCKAGLGCDYAAHKCIAALANGQECTSFDVCASQYCDISAQPRWVCADEPACTMP